MFYEENGNVIYNENIISDGSLFNSDADPIADQEALKTALDDIQLEYTETEDIPVSGGNAQSFSSPVSYQAITYNVYAVPSSATGYPNSSSVSYLEDVVAGYPVGYDYVAYRTSDEYAQPMILIIGPKAVVNGNSVVIENADIIEINYITGSGYNNYNITRSFSKDPSAQVTLNEETLMYTNVVPGYATFEVSGREESFNISFAGGLIIALLFFVIGRLLGGSNHV